MLCNFIWSEKSIKSFMLLVHEIRDGIMDNIKD